ncbi:MAG: transposase [Pyrinomonadaceae bacterium]
MSFPPKNDLPLIKDEWRETIFIPISAASLKTLEGVPLAIGGINNHVHLLVGLKSSHRLDYFVRDLKADSSAFIHKELKEKFEWQKGYGAFTVSPLGVENVRQYVLNQEIHHRQKTFENEYVELLVKSNTPSYGIEQK